jgi:hypothetical protein
MATRVMAAAAMAAAVAAIVRRAAAMAATAAIATIARAIATMPEGRGLLLTAHEGDSNQREKDRDTKNNNAIHPQILQLTYRYRKRNNQVAVCK